MRRLRLAAATIAILFGAVLLAGTAAVAVVTGRTGTFSDRQHFVHGTDAWSYSTARYAYVPNATRTVTVPAGTRRMLDVRFTAESQCTGSGWCTVRAVVTYPSGFTRELDPASGTDFAFDSASSASDNWEGHAIERTSPYLPAGTYRVRIQARPVGAATIRLDDWTLAVELVRP